MKVKRSRFLILGANGFIGSHLVDELVDAGFGVRAFDRFSKSAQFMPSPLIESFTGDIMNMAHIQEALKGVDYLFHCFSATTPFLAENDPFTDITSNLLQSVRLFEQAVSAKVKKIIYISSGGAVYGKIKEGNRLYEHTTPLPLSPYGISKLATEHYLEYFNQKFGMDYVIYRLTNPYGPRQVLKNNQGVVPSFIKRILDGEDVIIYGDGKSSRDYIYIKDATKMIVTSFYRSGKHSVYNIGSGRQVTLNKLLDTIQNQLGVRAQVKYTEVPKTFVNKSPVSIRRFSEDFGKPDITSLQDGLRATIKYSIQHH